MRMRIALTQPTATRASASTDLSMCRAALTCPRAESVRSRYVTQSFQNESTNCFMKSILLQWLIRRITTSARISFSNWKISLPFFQTTCPKQATDLMFLIDGSGSIGSFVFRDEVLRFVREFVDLFDIGRENTRVGVIQYSDQIRHEFDLGQYQDKQGVLQGKRIAQRLLPIFTKYRWFRQ